MIGLLFAIKPMLIATGIALVFLTIAGAVYQAVYSRGHDAAELANLRATIEVNAKARKATTLAYADIDRQLADERAVVARLRADTTRLPPPVILEEDARCDWDAPLPWPSE